MSDWVMIGVPSSAGAHHAGQERAPDALRAAGLAERLGAAGESVQDLGNLPGASFAVDRDHPGSRNLPAVMRVAREVADAVADAGTERLLLVVGVIVHFDVDTVDSGDLPLGNYPHYGSGVRLEHAVACLRVLRAHPSFAGLVLTEVNPTHDADGSLINRYMEGLAGALAA